MIQLGICRIFLLVLFAMSLMWLGMFQIRSILIPSGVGMVGYFPTLWQENISGKTKHVSDKSCLEHMCLAASCRFVAARRASTPLVWFFVQGAEMIRAQRKQRPEFWRARHCRVFKGTGSQSVVSECVATYSGRFHGSKAFYKAVAVAS